VWGGKSADDRAAIRRAHLIATGIELIGENGVGGITVRELYARAKLSPRYFYESFQDLDALLVAIYDQLLTDTVTVAVQAIEAAADNERAKTRAAIDAVFRFLTDDPRRIRILLADAPGNAALAARRSGMIHFGAEFLARNVADFYDIPADARLVRSSTHMLAGGLVELLIGWHDHTLELTVDELIDDAADLVSGTGDAARAIAKRRRAGR
jgi:AcrR family transcriptional regulator